MLHPPFHDAERFPRLQLRLYLTSDAWLGPGKADLLELIASTGSISEAGRQMGMSYRRAWSLVEEMNQIFTLPLVARRRGGIKGGGAFLTAAGADVLNRFRRIEAAAKDAASADASVLMAMCR